MTEVIDLYWSFRSPYCYLAGLQIDKALEHFDVKVRLRPVYPAAVRATAFFERVDPLWFKYFALDVKRCAEELGAPIRWPSPDPVAVLPGGQKPAPDQTRIRRLTALGVAAEEEGRGLPFAQKVGEVLWRGEIEDWTAGDHLARASAAAGLDLAALERRIALEPERYEAMIQTNEAAQREAGHWGVPLMVLRGEPFFGQDRLRSLGWRLERLGAAR